MRNKCGLFVVSCVLWSTGLSVVFSDYSSAWSGQLPECTGVPDVLPAIKADPRYDKDKTGYVIFKRGWSGPPLSGNPGLAIDWDTTDSGEDVFLSYTTSTSETGLNIRNGGSNGELYRLPDDTLDYKVNNGSSGNMNAFTDVTCISIAQNVLYKVNNTIVSKSDFILATGQEYPTEAAGGNSLDPAVPCDWYDIGCWMGDLGSMIVDTLQDLWDGIISIFERLIEFLTGLFIPSDENIFADTFSSLSSYMHNKLGFLTYPVDFMLALQTKISNDATWATEISCKYAGMTGYTYPSYCITSIPDVLDGNPLQINWGLLERNWPAMWEVSRYLSGLGLTIATIFLFREKYFEVVDK